MRRPVRSRCVSLSRFLAVLPIAGCGPWAFAQPTASQPTPNAPAPAAAVLSLTLEQIMSDPDWIARSPERPFWSDDSTHVYYIRKRLGEERRDTFKVNVATGEAVQLGPADLPNVESRVGAYSRNRRLKAYSRAGDLYLKDLTTGRVQQMTRTGDGEFAPRFLVGDFRIVFQRGSQTYARDLATGLEYQIADVRAENKPDDREKEREKREKDDFLRAQQERLFAIVKKNKSQRDAAKQQEKEDREADTTRTPRPWYLGEDREIRQQSLSPSAETMIVSLAKKGAKEGKSDAMPAYVTDDGYVSMRNVRAKVGTTSRVTDELVLLDLAGRSWQEPEGKDEKKETNPTTANESPATGDEATMGVSGASIAAPSPSTSASKPSSAVAPVGEDGVYKLDLSVLPGIADEPLKELQEKAKAKKAPASPAPSTSPSPAKQGDSKSDAAAPASPPTAEHGKAEAKPSEGESNGKKAEKPKPRGVSVSAIDWNEEGTRAIVQIFSHDNKDYWIALVDAATKAFTPLEHFHDDAWINEGFARLGWLRDGRTFWFLSEESGYAQVYFRDVVDSSRWPLRPTRQGDQPYEVVDIDVNLAGDVMYLVASLPGRPGVREAYRVLIGSEQFDQRRKFAAQGSEVGFPIQQLTEFGGQNDFWASPDDRYGLVMHSTTTRPPELYAIPLLTPQAITTAQATRLTSTVTPEFAAMQWLMPEILPIPSQTREGESPRAIWTRVYDFGRKDQGTEGSRDRSAALSLRPAVIFIHGAGYLQDAHEGWSHYFREQMFNTMLAQRGYVVLDMDYRASAGYGRDWRTAIYRQMGYPELDDLQDGIAWLVKERGVDPKRIGCYGGSYGGFLTLMAMFTRPDMFACGAALRPVTDWAHYNEGYTSNILNVPGIDPESFEKSSPIEFADGLRGHLLICHGMQDDNVLFQDTVRLSQRLIELKKENWEVAVYPIEPHGFKEPTSWLDEYRRIDKLFRTHLENGAGRIP